MYIHDPDDSLEFYNKFSWCMPHVPSQFLTDPLTY
jgi:hypothetical protein